jgi:hypothetical protein
MKFEPQNSKHHQTMICPSLERRRSSNFVFRIWNFEFVSNFYIRISSFWRQSMIVYALKNGYFARSFGCFRLVFRNQHH